MVLVVARLTLPAWKQNGRILMGYTCRHRLLRDCGFPLSPIIVYARCVNIVFYRWIPVRGSVNGRSIGQMVFSWHSFLDGIYASRGEYTFERFAPTCDHGPPLEDRETRESYDQWARWLSIDSFFLFFFSSQVIVSYDWIFLGFLVCDVLAIFCNIQDEREKRNSLMY